MLRLPLDGNLVCLSVAEMQSFLTMAGASHTVLMEWKRNKWAGQHFAAMTAHQMKHSGLDNLQIVKHFKEKSKFDMKSTL